MKSNKKGYNWPDLPDGAKIFPGCEMPLLQSPAIDMYDTDDERVLLIDLPGSRTLEYIHLKQSGTCLIIGGNVVREYDAEVVEWHWNERFNGPFQRIVPIPFPFSANDITCFFQNGILEIRIAKGT